MTEKEAIEVLLKNVPKCCKMVDGRYQGGFDDWDCDMGQAIRVAVLALQDIQQYRAIGTVEELTMGKRCISLVKRHGTIGEMIDECVAYEEIGTVEDIRDLLIVISEGSDNTNEDGIDLEIIKNLIELKHYRVGKNF